jgi:ferritin-like metal-binding protein YciE
VVREIAKVLGQTRYASMLQKTLAEEIETDERLSDLAKQINSQANEEGAEEQQGASKRERMMPKHAA